MKSIFIGEYLGDLSEETCEKTKEWFQSLYLEHVSLTNKPGTEEK